MPGTTSTALPSFSHDQHHKTDAAKRKGRRQGQSRQAIKLFQITPYVNDFQTLNSPGSQQSRFLTACRRLEKLVLPSIFDTNLSYLLMQNSHSYMTTVLNERIWHFRGMGVKTYSDPSYIFSRGQDPQPTGSTPLYGFCGSKRWWRWQWWQPEL